MRKLFLLAFLTIFMSICTTVAAQTADKDASAPGKVMCLRNADYTEVSTEVNKALSSIGFKVILSQSQFGVTKDPVPYVMQGDGGAIAVVLQKRPQAIEILFSEFRPSAQFNKVYEKINNVLNSRFAGPLSPASCSG